MPHIHPLRSPHRVGMRPSLVAVGVVACVTGLSASEVEAVWERSERTMSQPCTHAPELSASEVEAVWERSERTMSQPCTHAPEPSASEAEA